MVVIAISGPPGAGSSTTARRVAEKLDINYFSPGQYMKQKVEGNESIAAMRGWEDEEMSSEETHNDLDALQRRLAKEGDVVFDGKLSVHMLGDVADLTVWLDAPLEIRARRTAARDELSREEVVALIRERQQEEIQNWKEMYGFNYMDQEREADLVIDTGGISPEGVVGKVLAAIG